MQVQVSLKIEIAATAHELRNEMEGSLSRVLEAEAHADLDEMPR